jgi:hypothetical protein
MAQVGEGEVQTAWESAQQLEGHDPDVHRVVFPSGATIARDRFNRRGKFGWTIQDGLPVPFANLSMMQVATILGRQRRANYEQRREEAGLAKVTVWVPRERVQQIQKIAAGWCEETRDN